MSADNGIYILKTKSKDRDDEVEYRVIHAQAIDNIYYNILTEEYESEPILEELYKYFYDSPILQTERGSRLYAATLADEHDNMLEYGICLLDHSNIIFPTFSVEELMLHDAQNLTVIDTRRQQRDKEMKLKRTEATIHMVGSQKLRVARIYGWYTDKDGNEIHGELEGISEIIIPREGADFLPSDWNE